MISKRIFDIIVSIVGLAILLPVFAIIAILIKLFMPGPVFFIQSRIGKGGEEFRLLKFRTMMGKSKTSEGSFDIGDQSRITSFGRILRRLKLDEIPQLINVLKGEMSLVGPRPEVKKWTKVYPEKWRIVFQVKPGITDNASIEFRNEEEILAQSSNPEETYRNFILPRKLELYVNYANNNSFFGDLLIIIRTFQSVILK
jgi:lipopolysaccharide/colanic/teichoic acid biosynthesis glycosyltransferase